MNEKTINPTAICSIHCLQKNMGPIPKTIYLIHKSFSIFLLHPVLPIPTHCAGRCSWPVSSSWPRILHSVFFPRSGWGSDLKLPWMHLTKRWTSRIPGTIGTGKTPSYLNQGLSQIHLIQTTCIFLHWPNFT